MKQVTVLSEEYTYVDGKRIATVTTQTVSSKADDVAELANYMNTLAAHMQSIERLQQNMPATEREQRPYLDEIERMQKEIIVLEAAIDAQQQHIKGYDNDHTN